MSIGNIKRKLRSEAIEDENWLKEAEKRQEDRVWLDLSFRIAVKIGSFLKKNNIYQKDLAERMGCSPQFVHTILKGSENLTLETISKIERALGIELIKVVEQKEIEIVNPVYHVQKFQKIINLNYQNRYEESYISDVSVLDERKQKIA